MPFPPLALFKYTACTVNVRQRQANILLLSVLFPAHWLHGNITVLQLHRRLAAPLMGQCPKVLCPAQLSWWYRPAAGNEHVNVDIKADLHFYKWMLQPNGIACNKLELVQLPVSRRQLLFFLIQTTTDPICPDEQIEARFQEPIESNAELSDLIRKNLRRLEFVIPKDSGLFSPMSSQMSNLFKNFRNWNQYL